MVAVEKKDGLTPYARVCQGTEDDEGLDNGEDLVVVPIGSSLDDTVTIGIDSNSVAAEVPSISWWSEVLAQLIMAGPVMLTFLTRKSVDVVSVVFVGHLGAAYLSAAGIASVTANVSGHSMVIGLAGALSTICSQAYGSKDFVTFSLAPQRAMLILALIVCLPVSVLWMYSEHVMTSLGQSPELAKHAAQYLIVLIPSLWAYTASVCIQNWLHAQGKTRYVAIINLCVALNHPLWCYVYIFRFGWGYLGAAYALVTSKYSEVTLLFLYAFCSGIGKETNFQLSWVGAWQDWGPFLRLGLPNMVMMFEWWASEIIIFMAGVLPGNAFNMVSAMSIYQNTLAIAFMVPSSLHVAASTRVGNALGAGRPEIARMAAWTAPSLSFCFCCLISGFLYGCQDQWSVIFTQDEAVKEIVRSVMPALFVYVIFDGVQSALTGVLKGLGKQRIGGPVVVLAYYGVGLPLSYYLGFTLHQGVMGLCVGTVVGTAVHMLLYILVLSRTNFEREAKTVQRRMKREALKRRFPTAESPDDSDDDNDAANDGTNCTARLEDCEDCLKCVDLSVRDWFAEFICMCSCGRFHRRQDVGNNGIKNGEGIEEGEGGESATGVAGMCCCTAGTRNGGTRVLNAGLDRKTMGNTSNNNNNNNNSSNNSSSSNNRKAHSKTTNHASSTSTSGSTVNHTTNNHRGSNDHHTPWWKWFRQSRTASGIGYPTSTTSSRSRPMSEYELVQSCTDSLSLADGDNLDDEGLDVNELGDEEEQVVVFRSPTLIHHRS